MARMGKTLDRAYTHDARSVVSLYMARVRL
jgi:hypothetical protein